MPRASKVVVNTLPDVNAYQSETPMHTVGTKLHHTNVAEAIKAAGIGWSVSLEPMFTRFGDKEVPVTGRRAVVRNTDGAILSTVGSAYHAVQNLEAFQILQPAIDEFGVVIDAAGVIGKGDRVWMMGKLPESIEAVSGDKLEAYFLLLTGHNGWTPLTGRIMPMRLCCLNQLPSYKNTMVHLRHSINAQTDLIQASKLITNLAATFKEMGVTFKKLASAKMRTAEMTAYFNQVLNIAGGSEVSPVLERRREKLVDLSKNGMGQKEFAPGTAWAALNAVTEYVDHVRPAEVKASRTLRQANESAVFGTNARLKLRAFTLAQQAAGLRAS